MLAKIAMITSLSIGMAMGIMIEKNVAREEDKNFIRIPINPKNIVDVKVTDNKTRRDFPGDDECAKLANQFTQIVNAQLATDHVALLQQKADQLQKLAQQEIGQLQKQASAYSAPTTQPR